MRCYKCGIPLLPGKWQRYPDKTTLTWWEVRLGDCPRCGTTLAITTTRRQLTDEERQEAGLPPLDRFQEVFQLR